MQNAISWFEIPTTDLNRATTFYETTFECQLVPMDMPGMQMRVFPVENMETSISGALVYGGDFHTPSSTDGPLIYLNANQGMEGILDRVAQQGGNIIVPRTEISPEHGYMAVIIDSEGNRIGLHSIA